MNDLSNVSKCKGEGQGIFLQEWSMGALRKYFMTRLVAAQAQPRYANSLMAGSFIPLLEVTNILQFFFKIWIELI